MTFVSNARMYAVSPEAEADWKDLIAHAVEDAGASFAYLTYAAPQPLEELWRRADLGCVQMCGYPIALNVADVVPLASPVPAAPWAGGKAVYRTDLIVRKDAPYGSLADTFGGTAGWTVEHSHSGFNALAPSSSALAKRWPPAALPAVRRPSRHGAAHPRQRASADGTIDIGPLDAYWHMLMRKYRPGMTANIRILESTAARADAGIRRRAGIARRYGPPPARLLCGGAFAALVRTIPGSAAHRGVREGHAGDIRSDPGMGPGRQGRWIPPAGVMPATGCLRGERV